MGGSVIRNNNINYNLGYAIDCNIDADIVSNTINSNEGFAINGGKFIEQNTISNHKEYVLDCNNQAIIKDNIFESNQGILISGSKEFIGNSVRYNESDLTFINAEYLIEFKDNIIEYNQANESLISTSNRVNFSNNIINNNIINSGNLITTLYELVINGFSLDKVDYPLILNANQITNNIVYGNLIKSKNIQFFQNNQIQFNEVYNFNMIDFEKVETFDYNNIANNTHAIDFENQGSFDYNQSSIVNINNLDYNDLYIHNNIFELNNVAGSLIKLTSSNASNPFMIYNNQISNNTSNFSDSLAYNLGSMLWIDSELANISIYDNNFTDNSSFGNGGAIFINNLDSLYLLRNIISNNQILNEEGFGAGLYATNGNIVIEQNTITFNQSKFASGLFLSDDVNASISGNIITNNIGEYAVWGLPESLTQNNIYFNVSNDNELRNLRYTGENSNSFIYNFWGSRSDQGQIDPSIYDDNESDGLIGEINYQPILTSPSEQITSGVTNISNIFASATGYENEQIEEAFIGVGSFDINLLGIDANSFAQDFELLNIINLSNYLPLQPMLV